MVLPISNSVLWPKLRFGTKIKAVFVAKIPISHFNFRPEVENMTSHNSSFNSIYRICSRNLNSAHAFWKKADLKKMRGRIFKNFYFIKSGIKFRVNWYVYCIFSTYVKWEIGIYENFRFSPVFPVSPILIHSSFDSKSFSLSSGKISCQNNTDIVWGRPTSGLDFRPEVKNMTMHSFRVNPIHP